MIMGEGVQKIIDYILSRGFNVVGVCSAGNGEAVLR